MWRAPATRPRCPGVPDLVFAIPGDPDQRTGGYLYDRRLGAALSAHGWKIRPLRLPDDFPAPSLASMAETERLFAAIPDGTLVLVDGLAFGVLPDLAARHGARLVLVALVHHPLGYETGLSPEREAALIASERTALAHARRVLVTSATTQATLAAQFGVPEARLAVALPGTDPAPVAKGSGKDGPALLAVGSILPRKDFPALVQALLPWRELAWTLTIAGSTARDPKETARLRQAIARAGLEDRVILAGEIDALALDARLDSADLFVSSSRYEGFGMALAEAIARALPVVAVAGGAIADWLDRDAAVLVPPDRPEDFARALGLVLRDHEHRARLRAAALTARRRLQGWADTARAADALLREAIAS